MTGEWIISSCVLILVVLALRAVLGKRISARLRYGLWAVVLVRLLVPVAFFSLAVTVPKLPSWTPPESFQEETIYFLPVDSEPAGESSVYFAEDGTLITDLNSFGYARLEDGGEKVVRYAEKLSPLELAEWIWMGCSVVLGGLLLAFNLRFGVRLRRSRRRLEGAGGPVPVYVAAGLPSPCLFGLLRPAVYVTGDAAEDPVMLRHVMAHELTHYRHLDHLWSVLRGAALAVHWWNPLVWLAVVLSRRDGELACDEGALRQLGDSERTAYGETLLSLVTAKARPQDLLSFATTMSGGKRSLRERIRRIACPPKRLMGAMAAVIAVITLSSVVAFGQTALWMAPDSATGFTYFNASSYTVTPRGTIVYTPDDLQKDLSAPKDAIEVPLEDGKELIRLINAHRKSVYGQGDLTLNGQEHHFIKIDCADGGFYLLDYWYWSGFSFNPLHLGEDSFTTLITCFDANGNAGTTWQMEYDFDKDYRQWRTDHVDVLGTTWQENMEAELAVSTDLNRDGRPESVRKLEEAQGKVRLEVICEQENSSGVYDVLWSDTLDETHGGCNTYFLYQENGLDYLLEYMPKMQQGQCTYSYRLFHLENGGEVTDRENRVEFDINFASQSHQFDPAEIAAFMEEVNSLIGRSQLLVNTNYWMLNLKEDGDGRLYDDILAALNHPGEDLSGMPLAEALEIYARQSEDHPDDTNSSLGDLLAGLEPEDIGDISGQREVTAAELAKLLREAAGQRASRYYAYESFVQVQAWQNAAAEWAVPLADGGTLYLLSCDSGNVEMVYETAEEATAAYFYQPEELYTLITKVGEAYPMEALSYTVDLDRDRSPDELALRSDRSGTAWSLQCRLGSGSVWGAEAYTAHVGWISYYLCRMDGEDYLLMYQPWSGGGGCNYTYKLFYLDENGREVSVQENEIFFDLNFEMEGMDSHSFNPQAIADFMDEINALLEHSTLLLNTDPQLADTFEREGRLYDSVSFLDACEGFTRDMDASLLENLLAYRNQSLANASTPYMEEVMANIQLEDLRNVDGDCRQAILDGLYRAAGEITWSDETPEILCYLAVDYVIKPNINLTHRICLEATATENLLRVRCEGTNPVLIYSENPADMDTRYLRDVPYSLEFYVEDGELYQLVLHEGNEM